MSAPDRLLVLMSRAEKSALSSRAAAAKVSMGELVRRAVSQYQPEQVSDKDEEAALLRLTAELRAATKRAQAALTQAERDIEGAIAMLRKARAQARRSPARKAA